LNPKQFFKVYDKYRILKIIPKSLDYPFYDSEECELLNFTERPNSFLILGYPSSKKGELAKKLQEHYNCIYIDIDTAMISDIESKLKLPEPKKKSEEGEEGEEEEVEEEPQDEEEEGDEEAKKKKAEIALKAEQDLKELEDKVNEWYEKKRIPHSARVEYFKQQFIAPNVEHRGYVLDWSPAYGASDETAAKVRNLSSHL
jgi:hypothetical protein